MAKSTSQNLIVGGVVVVGGYFALKYISKHFGGGGNGTTLTGPAGGGAYAPPYYPDQPQSPLQLPKIQIGGGSGAGPAGHDLTEPEEQLLELRDFQAAGNQVLGQNAPGYLAADNAAILAGSDHLAEQPIALDSGKSFLDWFNSGGSASDYLPSGSIGDASSSQYVGSDYGGDYGGDYSADGSGGSSSSDYSGYGAGDAGGYSDYGGGDGGSGYDSGSFNDGQGQDYSSTDGGGY